MAVKRLKISLVRSLIGCKDRHKRTIQALGLRKINQAIFHDDNACIRGMIARVNYLLHVEEV